MIIFRYIFFEILKNFLGSFFILNALLLLSRFASLLIELSSERLAFQDYTRLFIYLAPYFLTFTIPLAALVGVVFTFMRLSQDQEILAFESLGIRFSKLVYPVIVIASLACVCAFIVTIKYLPWSKKAFREFLFELTERKIARGLPPKTFINWIPNLSIFVQETKAGGKRLTLVFMVDESNPTKQALIFASQGKLCVSDSKVRFELKDGCIHLVNKDYTITEEFHFKEYIYLLDLNKFRRQRHPSRGEMSLAELKRMANRFKKDNKKSLPYLIEYWKRLAFPWSAMILTLLGAPLGAMMRTSGRGIGLILAASLFLSYYFLFSGATTLAQKHLLPLSFLINLPNLIFALLVFILIILIEKGKIKRLG